MNPSNGLVWNWIAKLFGTSWQSSLFGFLKLATMAAIGYPDIIGGLTPKWRGILFVLYGIFNATQGRMGVDPSKIVTVDNPPAPVLHVPDTSRATGQAPEKPGVG